MHVIKFRLAQVKPLKRTKWVVNFLHRNERLIWLGLIFCSDPWLQDTVCEELASYRFNLLATGSGPSAHTWRPLVIGQWLGCIDPPTQSSHWSTYRLLTTWVMVTSCKLWQEKVNISWYLLCFFKSAKYYSRLANCDGGWPLVSVRSALIGHFGIMVGSHIADWPHGYWSVRRDHYCWPVGGITRQGYILILTNQRCICTDISSDISWLFLEFTCFAPSFFSRCDKLTFDDF